MPDLSNYPTTWAPLPILPKLTEIRDSLVCVNNELTILGHVAEGISGAAFHLSQVLIFNIASLSKIIENEPQKQPQDKAIDFGLFIFMTIHEKAQYDEISGLRHRVISEWRFYHILFSIT